MTMKTLVVNVMAAALLISTMMGCADADVSEASPVSAEALKTPSKTPSKKRMRAFGSEQELSTYFRELAEERKRESLRVRRRTDSLADAQANTNANAAAPAASAKAADESITNVQHAGVDEGGIVKLHGEHLVVLRRGRLFTVAIGDGALP